MRPYYEDSQVTIYHGDCRDVLPTLEPVDTCVTDPPYNLAFMGKSWDSFTDEDAAFAYWLSGFTDGEGCFRVQRHTRGTYTCAFQVKVRRDDGAILREIQRFVGAGTINHPTEASRSNPVDTYVVQDKAGCLRVARLFLKYPLRAKKLRDFLAWAEAVFEWNEMPRGNRWHGPADYSRLAALKERIERAREYREPAWSGNGFQDFTREWAELLPVKPGGLLVAFGGTRTAHRLMAGIEDAGWEVRDSVLWVHGQGFPKSLDLGKATGDAAWDGWGTALKPACEIAALAMRPLDGTFAENAIRHGVAGLHVDGGRIEAGERPHVTSDRRLPHNTYGPGLGGSRAEGTTDAGRWPANVILDEEAARMLDEQSGERASGSRVEGVRKGLGYHGADGDGGPAIVGSVGGASRFFYTAKASQSERGEFNDHPTVKPLDLMAYLCRLTATPTGGVVLDPFMGSGSTLIAANRVGRRAIGIELDERSCEIAAKRLEGEPPDLFAAVPHATEAEDGGEAA